MPNVPKWKLKFKKIESEEECVRHLAGIGCSQEEIAYVMGVSRTYVQTHYAVKRGDLPSLIEEGKADMRMRLRGYQFAAAKRGNPAMLCFLGKNYLGQADRLQLGIGTLEEFEDTAALCRAMDGVTVPGAPQEKAVDGHDGNGGNGGGDESKETLQE